MSIILPVRQQLQRLMSTEPKDAIPAVLFSMMVATIVFIGEPPYALAKEPKVDKTAKVTIVCSDKKECRLKSRG